MATTETRHKKEEPKATDVLVAFVLDKSGSMGNLRDATVEGFNAFLDEQRALPAASARVSLTLFDTEFSCPFVALDVHELPNLGTDQNPYRPSGGTALYDAVGLTIKGVEGWLANHPAWSGRVIIGVWTDGEENSSTRWALDALNKLILERQAAEWEFVFMGTGHAAWTEGQNFVNTVGHHNTVPVAPSGQGVSSSYAAMSGSVSATRTVGQVTNTASRYNDAMHDAQSVDTATETEKRLSEDPQN